MSLHKALGLAGGTATAVGGGVLVSKSSLFQDAPTPVTTKQKETFKQKYKFALFSEEDSLWDTRFSTFSNGKQPTHPKLTEAKSKSSSQADDAKALHKQGCKAIYDSEIEDSPYLEDFKNYCSKTIKDGITGTWIEQNNTQGDKWNPKLTSLKDHADAKDGVLDDKLKALKAKLTAAPSSSPNWDNDKRKELTDWCDAAKSSIFMGDEDSQVKHSKLYCVENKTSA
ncbi:hypothetical protein HF1_08410 [Mycoplasma haemofelis str. Langford 1]|uniref:Uncharacterized protein n=2 Tax=Mycoplasma haemofelis TaxID=29501 RepID=F6FIY0_MYCHI|nr:hypothetical protein [Mycoplasma haemofelis]AEG73178.1 hypothetical protein MHF_0921 [Mycoplasma haemofelis Ohio2]CBY92849.1 hypothetical protein HF1_08410 [Mycoplasma haemofelis str. Langford 1]